jgi:hypothetical protein
LSTRKVHSKQAMALHTCTSTHPRVNTDPLETADLYKCHCASNVSAKALAMMAATLANGGVNPATTMRRSREEHVPKVFVVMAKVGLYDNTGRRMYDAWACWRTTESEGPAPDRGDRAGLLRERPPLVQVMRARWWCAVAACAAIATAIPAHAQSGDDSLIRIQPRDSGRMMLTAMFGLVQRDPAAPEQTTGFPRLVVRATVARWNATPVLSQGVDLLFGLFPTQPDSRPTFAYQVGDAPAEILGARWNCVPGMQGNYQYGVFTRVPIRAIRSMTDSAVVIIWVAGVEYRLLSNGKRILSALVAHLPADSATPAMVPADTSLRIYYDFEVERRARPKYETMHAPQVSPGVKGEVVLGFIVDTTGRIEKGSLRVIRAPDSSLARAVRKAFRDFRHDPAMSCGRPVPQYREDSFIFTTH